MKAIQRNGYKISFSKTYEKWVVKVFRPLIGWVALEEFEKRENAIKWAKNN